MLYQEVNNVTVMMGGNRNRSPDTTKESSPLQLPQAANVKQSVPVTPPRAAAQKVHEPKMTYTPREILQPDSHPFGTSLL